MTKPRVLTLIPSAQGGGAERLVLEQMRRYDRSAYEYSVVALRPGPLTAVFGENPEYSCTGAITTFSPWVLWRLRRRIRDQRIQLLHTHLQEADFYGYLLKRMEPNLVWVSTRHNTDDFRKRWFWRTLNRAMSRRLDRTIAVSRAVRDFVQQYEAIPADKVEVILNGVDLTPFEAAMDRASARRTFGLAEGDFAIGVVGRLTHQKGHRFLLEAAALLRNAIPGLVVLVAGRGGLLRALKWRARHLGIADRVRFLGFRQDTATLYRALDVFCLPSLFEGFGLVLVEAMASGCVTVATSVHGITEVIEDGRNGMLVRPADPADLAGAITRVYRNEFDQQLRTRAGTDARERFDIRRTIASVEKLYLRLLTG